MKNNNRNQRPEAPEPDWEAIPEELRALRQWVVWRYVWKDGESGKGSWTKLPLQPNGQAASSTDSATWSQFETVRLAYLQQAGRFSGIGFVFTRESGYVGIDLDECITWGEGKDRHIPTYNDWAQRLFERLSAATDGIGTYTEFSPSRTGLHFIVKANPSQAIKLPEIEIYPEGRYFTMTGSTCWSDDVRDCTETIDEIVAILLGEREAPQSYEDSTPTEHPDKPKKHNLTVQQRIDMAFHAVNGEEVRQLFCGNIEKYKRGDNEGRSEADMALASYFAFYCDGDPEILSQMMLQSKLVRPKYVRILSKKDGRTYLEKTIELVLSRQKKFYNEGEMIFNFVPHTAGTTASKSQKRYQLLELGEAAIKDRHDPNAQGLRVGEGYYELDEYYRPRRGLLSIIVGDPGSGKALALDTKLPTPTGWTTMGEVKVGDHLLDETGYICRVMMTTPVMHDHTCYRVTFNDGSEIIADADHLWTTRTEAARQRQIKMRLRGTYEPLRLHTSTTEQIKNSLLTRDKTKRRNHAVQVIQPIQLPEQEYMVDPYVLGAWLGDGASAGGRIYSNDPEIVEEIAKAGFDIQKKNAPFMYQIKKLQVLLRSIGVLGNKHIPQNYLRGSYLQRLALLQGLMDTDGHISTKGDCEFTSMNRRLAEGVKDLLNGLGVVANIGIGRAMLKGKDCGTRYRVGFSTTLPVFRLPRKASRLPKVCPYNKWRTIEKVEEVDSVPVKCIQVNSPSKLYLAGKSYIPTHNTTLTLNYLFHLARKHNLRAGLSTFENDPIDIAHSLVQAHLRKPTFPELDGACTDQEFLDALDQIGNQFTIYQPSWDESNCQALVENYWEPDIKGDGLDILFLDPFSNLQPPPELLGKYTDFANQQLAYYWRYIQSRALLGFLCCHPTKNYDRKQGPPKLWNINGSGAFDRCADYGLGIMRQDHRLIVEIQKIRKWRTGSMGETIALSYRQSQGEYQRADLPAKYRQNGFQRKKAGIRF